MTTITVDLDELARRGEAGLLRRQKHPSADLWIYNYTEACQYQGAWDEYTRMCRGLILDADGRIVARPFPKFFNYGEPSAPEVRLDDGLSVVVTDKLDGSLGILYPVHGGLAVATRGSFASTQALHATNVLWSRYDGFRPMPDMTCLFEIIYPANRIVVDYHGLDELVLIGAVDVATGLPCQPYPPWPGPSALEMPYSTLADAVAAPPRRGREGLVVYFPALNDRVKLKQDDYVALHRIVTGLSERTVWQHLVDDKSISEMLDGLPDEFHSWVERVALGLLYDVAVEASRIADLFDEVVSALVPYAGAWPSMGDALRSPDGRRSFAELASRHDCAWALFALLDDKDIVPRLLRDAKPDRRPDRTDHRRDGGVVSDLREETVSETDLRLVVTRGVPGSGKTTWARAWVAEDEASRARVNRDDLRQAMFGLDSPLPRELEETVSVAQNAQVRALLRSGRSVVVDDMHLRRSYVEAWRTAATESGADLEVVSFADVPVGLCVERDAARGSSGGRAVGEKFILEAHQRLASSLKSDGHGIASPAPPTLAPYEPDPALPPAWIVDVDGTLAVMKGRGPFEWHRVVEDDPKHVVIDVVRALKSVGNAIVVTSGRDEVCRGDTLAWLAKHEVPFDRLLMRRKGDQRKDAVVKRELLDEAGAEFVSSSGMSANGYRIVGVLDDRDQVVEMWRAIGLTCLQVAPGDF